MNPGLVLAQVLPLTLCLGGPALFVTFLALISGAAP